MTDETKSAALQVPADLLAILDQSIEKLTPELADLDLEQLYLLLAAEKTGKTRSGAIEAIGAAIIGKLPPVIVDGNGEHVTQERWDLGEAAVGKLGEILVELDLRGTEDLGAVGVAGIRLMELADARVEAKAEFAKIGALFEELGIPASAGPEDATIVDKLIFLYRAADADRKAIEPVVGDIAPVERTLLALPEEPVATVEGERVIVFSEGDGLIGGIEPIAVGDKDLQASGGMIVVTSKIAIGGAVEPARITHAWLIADGVPVRRCEIPNGLSVGGGRGAEFASGSLAF